MTQKAFAGVTIDITRSEAWKKLSDISLAHHYVPGIIKTEIVSENASGVGASRYVYRNKRSYIQETIEEWQPEQGYRIRLHRGEKPAPPFKKAWFEYHLDDTGNGGTQLTVSLEFELPWGPLGLWLEPRLLKSVTSIVKDVAYSAKLYYETGLPTTAAALKAYKSSLHND